MQADRGLMRRSRGRPDRCIKILSATLKHCADVNGRYGAISDSWLAYKPNKRLASGAKRVLRPDGTTRRDDANDSLSPRKVKPEI
jgi:hypothetical protein